MEVPERVWYASYGSNLNESRFMIYITGGKLPGSVFEQPGCRDKTEPKEIAALTLPHDMYFAGWAPNIYGGGTAGAFLRLEKGGQALSRGYLISSAQFEDVVRQENGYINTDTGELGLDLTDAIEHGHSRMLPTGFYDELIYCGEREGWPVLSVTHSVDLVFERPPSPDYLRMIASGIRQAHGIDDRAIVDYFASRVGIAGHYTADHLTEILG
jgi:hypothetical protein